MKVVDRKRRAFLGPPRAKQRRLPFHTFRRSLSRPPGHAKTRRLCQDARHVSAPSSTNRRLDGLTASRCQGLGRRRPRQSPAACIRAVRPFELTYRGPRAVGPGPDALSAGDTLLGVSDPPRPVLPRSSVDRPDGMDSAIAGHRPSLGRPGSIASACVGSRTMTRGSDLVRKFQHRRPRNAGSKLSWEQPSMSTRVVSPRAVSGA